MLEQRVVTIRFPDALSLGERIAFVGLELNRQAGPAHLRHTELVEVSRRRAVYAVMRVPPP